MTSRENLEEIRTMGSWAVFERVRETERLGLEPERATGSESYRPRCIDRPGRPKDGPQHEHERDKHSH